MVYGYTVKFNGEYYPAGVDVPDDKGTAEVELKTSALLNNDEAIPKRKPGRPPKNKEQ